MKSECACAGIRRPGTGLAVDARQYNPDSLTATFEPDNPLSYFTTYTVTIKEEVQDQNSIEMSGDFSWSFTTEMGFLIWDARNWDQAKWDY